MTVVRPRGPSAVLPTAPSGPSEVRASREIHGDAFVRGLIRGLRCGLIVADRDGKLILVNDVARQILEIEDPCEPGTPLPRALAPHTRLSRVLADAFTLTHLPNRAEMDLVTATGKTKSIGFTVSLISADREAAGGAAVFFKDLTHVEHREEQERLRDRLAALGQMAANLAHEIRNPLASIEVSCSLLKRRMAAEPEGRELFDKIISEVRRLNRTISSSLEFVRPLSLSPVPTRIATVLDAALQSARERFRNAGIRVERRYAPGLTEYLLDPAQLRQVFDNLFINAVEAMGDEGTLAVETVLVRAPASASTPYEPEAGHGTDPWRSFDHYVEVRVRDTGPGIPAEHRDKLFYPFFTTKKHGSGVGLSLAKKIVDSHRGLIDVETPAGEGAEFIVRLPAVGAEAKDPTS